MSEDEQHHPRTSTSAPSESEGSQSNVSQDAAQSQVWRSTAGLSQAITVMLMLVIVATVVSMITLGHRIGVIDDFTRGFGSLRAARDADHYANVGSALVLATTLLTGIVWIIWQWRSAKNAEMLGLMELRLGAGWHIGGWFLPFANFVIPIRAMQDLWQSSEPEMAGHTSWRQMRRSTLIGWWWAAFLIGTLGSRASMSGGNTLDEIRQSNQIGLAARAWQVAAAVLAILVVRSVTHRQVAARQQMVS